MAHNVHDAAADTRLVAKMRAAQQMLGNVSRPTVYSLIDLGELESLKIGRDRFITIDSIKRYVYVLQAGDVGEYLFCEVTAHNTAGSTTQSSNLTGLIAAPTMMMDAAHKHSVVSLTNANLTASVPDESGGSPGWRGVYGSVARSAGKYYFEVEVTNGAGNGFVQVGLPLSCGPAVNGVARLAVHYDNSDTLAHVSSGQRPSVRHRMSSWLCAVTAVVAVRCSHSAALRW